MTQISKDLYLNFSIMVNLKKENFLFLSKNAMKAILIYLKNLYLIFM
jgi:hypothetical protein